MTQTHRLPDLALLTLKEEGCDLPIMVSGTITDASGRTLSGH